MVEALEELIQIIMELREHLILEGVEAQELGHLRLLYLAVMEALVL
jgi:hypothetical protein